MQFGQPPPTGRLISLTPLIDVVFILLVFFMLASSFLDWRSIDLKVSSGAGAATSTERAIVIDLRADGSLTVGTDAVSDRALRGVLKTKLTGKSDQRVIIRSETGVKLQRAVDILDLVRGLGVANVSLARKR